HIKAFGWAFLDGLRDPVSLSLAALLFASVLVCSLLLWGADFLNSAAIAWRAFNGPAVGSPPSKGSVPILMAPRNAFPMPQNKSRLIGPAKPE
ncbi:MAG: hypothetical protein WBX25_16600, partial [Rhodomicrobium sp.]